MAYIQGNSPEVESLLQRLPEKCAAILPGSGGQIICLKRGVTGYYPMHPRNLDSKLSPEDNVKRYNEARNVTPAQYEAMRYGSVFGWDTPAADPATWEESLKEI